jgi:hypothetical protein
MMFAVEPVSRVDLPSDLEAYRKDTWNLEKTTRTKSEITHRRTKVFWRDSHKTTMVVFQF